MRRTPKENINQSFINLIRKAHGLIENSDIEKHRHSQDQMGALFGNSREVAVTETTVGSMYAEWIRVDRPHSGKKIILYCHGGGYSTGSPLYARTLTTKLASQLSMDVFCFDYRLAPEHPYPAAVDDAQAAWDYLMLQGYGAKDIFVAGDSAGGNLALALGLSDLVLTRDGVLVARHENKSLVSITLHEGRNRIVRRMMDSVGHPVRKLSRTSIGPVRLGQMAPGTTRDLTREELGKLLDLVGMVHPLLQGDKDWSWPAPAHHPQ